MRIFTGYHLAIVGGKQDVVMGADADVLSVRLSVAPWGSKCVEMLVIESDKGEETRRFVVFEDGDRIADDECGSMVYAGSVADGDNNLHVFKIT